MLLINEAELDKTTVLVNKIWVNMTDKIAKSCVKKWRSKKNVN